MLTKKQRDLLEFIHKRVQKDGVPPSFDEMKEALDLRSKSGIHRLITALEERGFIRRLAHRARAIEVVKLPDSLGEMKTGFTPFASIVLALAKNPIKCATTFPLSALSGPPSPVGERSRIVVRN